MNKETLAIFTPSIGIRSETFIFRHITDLLPGRCVVVANSASNTAGSPNVPRLVLDQLPPERLRNMMGRLIFQKLGWPVGDYERTLVRDFLVGQGVTVAMGEYLNAFLPWLSLCKRLGIRTFPHAHGYDVSALLRNADWQRQYMQYREADGVITVNHVQRKRLIALGLEADRIHVVPCGVSVPERSNRLIEAGGKVRCLAVGRMVAKKAPILCLDAFRRAVELLPNIHLDYIGEGPLLSPARHFVKALNLDDKVTLHGGLDHISV